MVNKGQEALEFVLITALVFFGALFSLMIFGDKLAAFFKTDSSVAQSATGQPQVLNPSNPIKYNPDYATYSENNELISSANPSTIATNNNVDVTINSDGSASFVVGSQNVTIPSSAISDMNVLMGTTGSDGVNKLIDLMAYMIETHAAEYPSGDVPLEIRYGTGTRALDYEDNEPDETYSGTAEVNTVTIKVGDHLVILQQDQSCFENQGKDPCDSDEMKGMGTHTIDGYIDANGNFNATISSTSESMNNQAFNASLNTANGGLQFNVSNLSYKLHEDGEWESTSKKGTWDIQFVDSSKLYSF